MLLLLRAVAFLCILLLQPVGAFDVEGGGPAAVPRRPGALPPPGAAPGPSLVQRPGLAVAGAAAEVSKWYRAYQSFVAAAAKVSQLISFACGVWLIFSTPFALVGSAITLRFQEGALCVYLALFGALMVSMEVPLSAVQSILQRYFFFVYTRPGRGAFVVHVAVVASACKHVRNPMAPTRARSRTVV